MSERPHNPTSVRRFRGAGLDPAPTSTEFDRPSWLNKGRARPIAPPCPRGIRSHFRSKLLDDEFDRTFGDGSLGLVETRKSVPVTGVKKFDLVNNALRPEAHTQIEDID